MQRGNVVAWRADAEKLSHAESITAETIEIAIIARTAGRADAEKLPVTQIPELSEQPKFPGTTDRADAEGKEGHTGLTQKSSGLARLVRINQNSAW